MDIIVTTPKGESGNAAKEAADCIANGGGWYFRRLYRHPYRLRVGDRVYYTENGYITGYAIAKHIIDTNTPRGKQQIQEMGLEIIPECDVTGKNYGLGLYVFMDARSWVWLRPVAFKGFQGWRYMDSDETLNYVRAETAAGINFRGTWLAPKPQAVAV